MGDISGRRQVLVRLDAGFLAEVDVARGGRSRQAFVEAALRAWVDAGASVAPAGVRGVVAQGPRVVRASEVRSRVRPLAAGEVLPGVAGVVSGRELADAPKRFGCPERSCGFVAPSARATCRVHARRVVELEEGER